MSDLIYFISSYYLILIPSFLVLFLKWLFTPVKIDYQILPPPAVSEPQQKWSGLQVEGSELFDAEKFVIENKFTVFKCKDYLIYISFSDLQKINDFSKRNKLNLKKNSVFEFEWETKLNPSKTITLNNNSVTLQIWFLRGNQRIIEHDEIFENFPELG